MASLHSPNTHDESSTFNILITGAAGFIGPLLAAQLLSDPNNRVLLTDMAEPSVPTGVANPQHAGVLAGDLTSPAFVADLLAHPIARPQLHVVFILHGIMSASAEANPELSERVNVDSVRLLCQALSQTSTHSASDSSQPIRIIYASSLAVFGPPFPSSPSRKVPQNWRPTPQSTYGTHKLLTEIYLNEQHRRGRLDVFVARLPTVVVRGGPPTGAASSFLSGIIREPMRGQECVVPLRDRGFRAFVASPRTVVENLTRLMRMESGVLPAHVRQVLLPGISVSLQEMMDALAKYGGEDRLRWIREEENEGLGRILRSWPEDFEIEESLGLGLVVDESADAIVREYIEGSGRPEKWK
jgi:nucleoside-diphosphate-sugar epimerase